MMICETCKFLIDSVDDVVKNVVAWMPLPKPYKREKEINK